MSDHSKIEWCDASWNPLRGCTRVSEGCKNCYAENIAARFSGPGQPYEGLAKRMGGDARWTGKVRFIDSALDQPLRWRKPRRIFVNSMSDLFHESVPDEWIDRVFAVMAIAGHHQFQCLTKRPERARAYLTALPERIGDRWVAPALADHAACVAYREGNEKMADHFWRLANKHAGRGRLPLPNIWLGTSVEDQATADARIPHLLATPAAIRFVSYEPALGPVDFTALRRYNPTGEPWIDALRGLVTRGQYLARNPSECSFATSTQCIPPELPRLDWIIAGGESGPGARPMHPNWARSIRDQCAAADVAFLFKQWGAWTSAKGYPGHMSIRHVFDDGYQMINVGKKAAGRLLDGREHNEFPDEGAPA